MRYAPDGDQKVQKHEEVVEPQASAYACRIQHRSAQGFKVLCLVGN